MRNEFIEKIKVIPKDKLVFIDESGIEDNATIEYGWSKQGTRCYGEKVYQHNGRISMIAGLCKGNIIAPIIFEGNCNKEIFETYIKTTLIKELQPGQTVIMDNISFHKSSKVKELIESVGCSILFLPTYSPDLNPIEHYWFKIKNEIRKIASDFQLFFEAVIMVYKKLLPYRFKLYLRQLHLTNPATFLLVLLHNELLKSPSLIVYNYLRFLH